MIIGQILKYTFLPQIRPRLNELVASGFGFLASFMALAYRGVRLLPNNHPYLQSNMTGQYGVLDVFREAANNLHFSIKNIDQIIVFFALIAGLVILVIQFFLLLFAIMVNPASAGQPANYGEFFVVDNREQDIALRLLDKVFGVPEIFGTGEATETPFHVALHQLFQFYSIGLIVIAALILAYFIFAVIAETAQHGTPFGKRYNHVWAPIRLVAAIGLLVPISYGLNAGQWITLYAAKFGSGFATNGWIRFNDTLNDSLLEGDELVAEPNLPELKDTVAFMMIVHACKQAYILQNPTIGDNIEAWIISPDNVAPPIGLLDRGTGTVTDPDGFDAPDPSGDSLTPWSNDSIRSQGRIHIRFGVQDATNTESTSSVFPHCGEIVLINSEPGDQTTTDPDNGNTLLNSTGVITWRYYSLIQRLWNEGDGNYGQPLHEAALAMVESRVRSEDKDDPDSSFKTERIAAAEEHIRQGIQNALQLVRDEFEAPTEINELGWGGAGIWYNHIANANGRLTNAVMARPNVSKYPYVMEYTCEENQQQNDATGPTECYDPRLSRDRETQFPTEDPRAIATALSDVFDFWFEENDELTGNAFIDTINVVMGTQGLFDMCRNADIHPLAQIATAGKGLVEAAIRNLGFALGGGAAGILAPYFGPALQAASGFFVSVASMGILIGFILYYVIPFMPFLYFFFAVGGWVKGLFEAMVGVPLWALAHIRIDGEGLPGDAAVNGYFLIFEIFIRPILIIFGLLASLLIFAAMVKVLNEIFSLVVSNLSGFSTANSSQCGAAFDSAAGAPTGSIDYMRGPVDELFFTIVYAILVYMIGMASFKLIDMIPNQILRWMGAGVSTFNDQAGEPAEGLVTKLAVGGGIMGGQLQQAGSAAGQAAGNLGGAAARFVRGQ